MIKFIYIGILNMQKTDDNFEELRIVPTVGVHNFRDFGGYATQYGGRVVMGQLYRSGDHSGATDGDLVKIRNMNLSGVIDLRGSSEREEAPCRRPVGFSAPVYFSKGETAATAPHVEAASKSQDAETIRREMLSRYAELPFRPGLVDVNRQYFHAVANANGPTVVYCTAGKDRTGVLVAVMQSILGMHHDDIINDYLLTGTIGGQESRIEVLRKDLEKRFGKGLSEEAIRVVTGVDAEFLEVALRVIREQYGSVDGYARDVLGVTSASRDRILDRLVV